MRTLLILLLVPLAGCLDGPDEAREPAAPEPGRDDIIEPVRARSDLWDIGWTNATVLDFPLDALGATSHHDLSLEVQPPARVHLRFYGDCPGGNPLPHDLPTATMRHPRGETFDYVWNDVFVTACSGGASTRVYDDGLHMLGSLPCFLEDWSFDLAGTHPTGGLEVVVMVPEDPAEGQRILAEEAEARERDGRPDPCG